MINDDTILLTCDTTLGPMTANNSGVYTCTTYNNVDSDSKSVSILVKSQTNTAVMPEFIEVPEPGYLVELNQSETIEVVVTGAPKPEISWHKDGAPITQFNKNAITQVSIDITYNAC